MLSNEAIHQLITQLTLDEKIGMLHGDGIFQTKGVSRLNIPPLKMSDGPMGVRSEYVKHTWIARGWEDDFVTYFPSNTALAATWNPKLAYAFGKALGSEARSRGKDIILAPGVNLIRSPYCGRNFEYMSEDPFLTSTIGTEIIKGVQLNDVAACVKHFAANNQETHRMTVDAIVDERTLEELYYPAFYDAVTQGNAYSLMGAYNQLNGEYCCESDALLRAQLREKWGYKGVVVSDWGGVHSTVKAALSTMDIEMNVTSDFDHYFFANALKEAVEAGDVSMSVIDEKIHRILTLMNTLHMLDGTRKRGARNTAEHQLLTLQTAEESIVLLQNDHHFLPVDPDRFSSILVVGDNAIKTHANGGGSAIIKALYEHSPFTGISMLLGDRAKLTFVQGYSTEENASPSRQWELREEAIRAANCHELIIFIGGLNHDFDTEGKDRSTYTLPYAQDELIKALHTVNPNIISVNISGSAVDLSSLKAYSKALLHTWYNGMEGGRALAKVLFGQAVPSGKLPFTMAQSINDYASHSIGEFPGHESVHYLEGLMVGYRHFETNAIEALFPFGHGLSYTQFSYEGLDISLQEDVHVAFTLNNIGTVDGKEVSQVYIQHLSPRLPRPSKELKAYCKTELKANSTTRVDICIPRHAFMVYDMQSHQWEHHCGDFKIMIGSSVRDIRLEGVIHI